MLHNTKKGPVSAPFMVFTPLSTPPVCRVYSSTCCCRRQRYLQISQIDATKFSKACRKTLKSRCKVTAFFDICKSLAKNYLDFGS